MTQLDGAGVFGTDLIVIGGGDGGCLGGHTA